MRPRILCYGDSLTAGFHDSGRRFSPYGESLREGLEKLGLQCDISICGLSGYRTDEMLAQLNSARCQDNFGGIGKGLAHILDNEGHFDLVILMAGTNDFTPNTNFKAIQSRVAKLHETCHSRGVPTVMLAAPCNTTNMQLQLGQMLASWARAQNQVMAFINPEELIPRKNMAYWEPDQVHFTPSGSRALGLYLAPAIGKILQQLGQQPEEPAGPVEVLEVERVPSSSRGYQKAPLSSRGYHNAASAQALPFMAAPLRPHVYRRGGA